MRPALITILPMLAAAILVMVGGERVARRDVETRSPADRERLLDFDEVFRAELTRLDNLYLSHLDSLTDIAHNNPDDLSAQAAEVRGVRLIRIFTDKSKKNKNETIEPKRTTQKIPEIQLTGGKQPFHSKGASILDADMLKNPLPEKGNWLATSDPNFRLHCRTPELGVLLVFVIDVPEVRKSTTAHLTSWIETPLTPLREAGEQVSIESSAMGQLASLNLTHRGPAASIIPIRTLFGEWQIRSWDGLVITRSHDPSIMAIATTFAILLLASGIILFIQQKRALKLAAERVSFVNRVSHELGTPLTNLSLNLDLATESLTERPQEARRRLNIVGEEIERLSRLVANVLTFSHSERDSLVLKPTPCVPADVIRRVIESFHPALERRGIVIETNISAEDTVILDPDALSQITGNLISNVEKYASDGQWLGLTCELESNTLTLEVSDRGKGIPKEARQRIFLPFERVRQSINEGSSGTGLGLSIARDLARRMGGDLKLLESTENTTFRLQVSAPPPPIINSSTASP
jgi:signal transduction histidine kinase